MNIDEATDRASRLEMAANNAPVESTETATQDSDPLDELKDLDLLKTALV